MIKENGLGQNVRYYRERIGMTQEQLAFLLGYRNNSAIVKIENGTLDPNSKTISAIAKALNCGINALFNDLPGINYDEYISYLAQAEEWQIKAVREILKMPEKKESSVSFMETS